VFDTTNITDGMNASYELGQQDFNTVAPAVAQNRFSNADGIAIDPAGHQLFVADFGAAGRILTFDTSALASNMNASHVLGETDFTSSNNSEDLGGPPTDTSFSPYGLSYDTKHQRLFAYDYDASRIIVFDLSGGLTDDMPATGVIGAPSLDTWGTG